MVEDFSRRSKDNARRYFLTAERFSAHWVAEAGLALTQQPPTIYLAVRDGLLLGFACFDKPIGDIIPDSMVDSFTCLRETIVLKLLAYILGSSFKLANNPVIDKTARFWILR